MKRNPMRDLWGTEEDRIMRDRYGEGGMTWKIWLALLAFHFAVYVFAIGLQTVFGF